jgi:hypothetical protein
MLNVAYTKRGSTLDREPIWEETELACNLSELEWDSVSDAMDG